MQDECKHLMPRIICRICKPEQKGFSATARPTRGPLFATGDAAKREKLLAALHKARKAVEGAERQINTSRNKKTVRMLERMLPRLKANLEKAEQEAQALT